MRPNTKVAAGGIAGACTVILVWGIDEFGGIKVPAEVASALTTIFSFVVAYYVPERKPKP